MYSAQSVERPFKDYGPGSVYLWQACLQRFADDGRVVSVAGEVNMLAFPSSRGVRCIAFGNVCLTLGAALSGAGVEFREWISVGSMAILFHRVDLPRVKAEYERRFQDNRQWFLINCARASVALAVRSYRRRRDAIVREKKGGA